ncbi:hypothetical protein LCGC14_0601060 [marine sediment metagenome]|uniref:Uncharacterized protein n=1 Tax=marine sediment metagenome TaxID=412755 RepID=A0A0F9RAR2_9ZZZZ
MNNGQQSVFPQPFNETYREGEGGYVRSTGDPGLTKREYIAIEAMKGMLANPTTIEGRGDIERRCGDIAKLSFKQADVMLKEADHAERT